jgi:hypothetical protein
LAYAHEAHRRHGNDPVPAIAFEVLHMTPARCALAHAASSTDDVLRHLATAPFNVARLGVYGATASCVARLAELFRDAAPQHRQVTRLTVVFSDDVEQQDVADLAASLDGLVALRHLRATFVAKDAALDVLPLCRFSRDLRTLHMQGDATTRVLDLSPYCRLAAAPTVAYRSAALEHVILPDSVTLAPQGWCCGTPYTALAQVRFGPAVRRIAGGVLCRTGLTALDLSHCHQLAFVGQFAFNGCTALRSIRLPAAPYDAVDAAPLQLDDGCFINVPALSDMAWGTQVRTIGFGCFIGVGLTAIDLSACAQLSAIGERFGTGSASLTTVTLPDSVRTIGSFFLLRCIALQRVTVGSGLVELGDNPLLNTNAVAAPLDVSHCALMEALPEHGDVIAPPHLQRRGCVPRSLQPKACALM